MRIYDAWGRLASEQSYLLIQDEQVAVHTGDLAAGVYILDVRAANGRALFQERFVILDK